MKLVDEKWTQMELSHSVFLKAFDAFQTCPKDQRLEAMKVGYRNNRPLVVLLLLYLVEVPDLQELLPFLLSNVVSIHRYLFALRHAILRIPRDWLVEHVEEAAEPILKEGDDETFRRLLELYIEIDRALAYRLAERATKSTDADTRDAGSDFLEKFTG